MKAILSRLINSLAADLIVGLLIVVSIVLTALEATTPSNHPHYLVYTDLSMVITIVFVVELLIRWFVSKSTGLFFRTYWIDVLAVAPMVRPLRVFRVLRLLRLIRVGVMVSRRARKVFAILHEGLAENLVIFVTLVVLFLIGAIGMPLVERGNASFDSFEKSAWWCLFTLMAGEPIGGDAGTPLGKLLSAVIMMGGFTVFALLTGVVSAFMVTRLKSGLEAKDVELSELSKHYVICGWNRSVPVILRELQVDPQTANTPLVIVAELEEPPNLAGTNLNTGLLYFVTGDFTWTEVLKRVQVEEATSAILVADECKDRSDQDRDARTILAALMIEKMNPNIYTTAQILHRENEPHLRMAGVEDVIVVDEYLGNMLAHSSRAWGLVSVMNELLTSCRGNEFYKIDAQPDFVGKTFLAVSQLLKEKHDAILVSLEKAGDDAESKTRVNPPSDTTIESGDTLIVIANDVPKF